MTAFDRAWGVVKMPLDFDSIEEVKPKVGATVTTADFLHPDPDIDEKLKLILYGGSQIQVHRPEDVGDDPYDTPHDYLAQATYNQPVVDGVRKPLMANYIEVDEEHRRKGLATAMHDLMAHVAAKYDRKLHPAYQQSKAARLMWEKQGSPDTWPVRGDDL